MEKERFTYSGYDAGQSAALIPKTCGDCKFRKKNNCTKYGITVAFTGDKNPVDFEVLESCVHYTPKG